MIDGSLSVPARLEGGNILREETFKEVFSMAGYVPRTDMMLPSFFITSIIT